MTEKKTITTTFELRLHDLLACANAKLSADPMCDRYSKRRPIIGLCESIINETQNCVYRSNRKVVGQIGIRSPVDKLERDSVSCTTRRHCSNALAVKLDHDLVRAFARAKFRYSENALSSFRRLFARWSGNAEATKLFTATDMRLLARCGLPDGYNSAVIDLRRIDPQITISR